MPQQTLVNVKKTTQQKVDLQPGGATVSVEVQDSIPFANNHPVEVVTQASGRQTVDGMGAWNGSTSIQTAPQNLTGPRAAVTSNVGLAGGYRKRAGGTGNTQRGAAWASLTPQQKADALASNAKGGFNGLGDMVTNFLGLGAMPDTTKTVAIVGIAAVAGYFLFLRKK